MTDIAGLATANAIPLEIKKDGLQQRQNGDWVMRVVIQASDMDPRLTNAPMGTRFVAALVEINEQELPVQGQPRQEAPAKPQAVPDKPPSGAKRPYRDLPKPQQAGMRCAEAAFVAFLKEERPRDWAEAPNAVDCVRLICEVGSRAELATNHAAGVIWHQLDSQYLAWKQVEHA